MPSQLLSKESEQFQNFNSKDFKRPVPIDHLDKNGTTKETREKDLRRREKLPIRTDLLKYLNVSPFIPEFLLLKILYFLKVNNFSIFLWIGA
jgi:hypothetical protein